MFAAERVEAEEKYVAAHMGVEHLVYEACTRNIRALLFVNESNPSLYALHIILPVEQAKSAHAFTRSLFLWCSLTHSFFFFGCSIL